MTRARMIELQRRGDARGELIVAEEGRELPFAPRRLFALFDIAPNATRGHHAHRAQHQFLIMTSGSCTIEAQDGTGRQDFRLESPTQALYAPPLTWLVLGDFSPGAVCTVLASDVYDEVDYIRGYDEFVALVSAD